MFEIKTRNIICENKNLSRNIYIKKKDEKEYSLKSNFFDPSKSSPPNEFLIKLKLRLNNFNLQGCKIKEDNLTRE